MIVEAEEGNGKDNLASGELILVPLTYLRWPSPPSPPTRTLPENLLYSKVLLTWHLYWHRIGTNRAVRTCAQTMCKNAFAQTCFLQRDFEVLSEWIQTIFS